MDQQPFISNADRRSQVVDIFGTAILAILAGKDSPPRPAAANGGPPAAPAADRTRPPSAAPAPNAGVGRRP